MNKCKRKKKLTILESFVISLERKKKKFASTIKELKYALTLSNYYTISFY